MLHVPVYVEMVGIHSRDYGHGREELQEGAVELVRLGHYDRVVAYEQVGVIVLGYASEEGGTPGSAVLVDVGEKGGSSGLAVSACHGEAALALCYLSQGARALQQAVALLPDIFQFRHVLRNGRGIDHEAVLLVLRNPFGHRLVVDVHPLGLQGAGQIGRRTVVAADLQTLGLVISGNGAHSYSAYAYEIHFVVHLYFSSNE